MVMLVLSDFRCRSRDGVLAERHDSSELQRAPVLEGGASVGRAGIWVWDPESDFSYWNDVLREILGVGPEVEPNVEEWLEIVHPEDRETARKLIESRETGGVRYRIVNRDGEVRHVVVRSERVDTITQDGPERYMGVVIDITESYQASTLVADTVESISDAYMVLGRDWTVLYANRKCEEILGHPRDVLMGRVLWDFYPEALETPFFAAYRDSMENRRSNEVEDFYEPLGIWFEARVYPFPDGIAVYFRDVTVRHELEAERQRMLEKEQEARSAAEEARKQAEYQAKHDSLTGLIGRIELMRRLEEACSAGKATTLFFLDVDRFKLVNDSLGHAMGDQLLREVGRRLEEFRDHVDVIARFGGDEFVLALFDRDQGIAALIVQRILEELRRPFSIEGRLLHATASVGVAESTPGMSAEELLLNADVTLYRAKETGRDRMVWFDETLRDELHRRVEVEAKLREAIRYEALSMHFQPSYEIATGTLTDVEGLTRWTDPDLGPVSPGEFIPVAEESGLIRDLGSWATGRVAEEAATWQKNGAIPATFWANISTNQLVRPDIAFLLADQLEHAGLDLERFGIEVTESALVDDAKLAEGLSRVAGLGVKVAIDDFGTGFSSISRLRELPVDILKIDRSFIAGADSEVGVETLSAIVDLAHALGATAIAEGVETRDEFDAVCRANCDRVSGYRFGYPVPPQELPGEVEWGQRRLLEETPS